MTPKGQFALAVNSLAVGMFLIVGATRHLDPPFVVLGMVCVGVCGFTIRAIIRK